MWDECLNEQFNVVSNGAISSGCIGCLVPLVDCLRLCNDDLHAVLQRIGLVRMQLHAMRPGVRR